MKRQTLVAYFKKKFFSPKTEKSREELRNIPFLAGQVLNLILLSFVLIGIRVWLLSVVQHESRLEMAKKPQQRKLVEPTFRASIRDRFNTPLAMNKLQYNVAILYSSIMEVPRIIVKKDKEGNKVKIFKRTEVIKGIASILSRELGLDAERVEDLIYSQAAIFPNVPFIIKNNIDEKTFYRLKMLEKDWPGICVQITPKRVYPQGKVAGDLIGYLGSIDQKSYKDLLQEINSLKKCLIDYQMEGVMNFPLGFQSIREVKNRLEELEEKSYRFNDVVGKSGLEQVFEEHLRGFYGLKSYQVDAKGRFIKTLPGSREPVSGKRIVLTLSSELQACAERLLIESEGIREGVSRIYNKEEKKWEKLKQPWIKGGAIIAMDPNNGEVLAMASYPRIDPNDFISSGEKEKKEEKRLQSINRWLETEAYMASLWDQQTYFTREIVEKNKGILEEKVLLTWDRYLDFILPKDSRVIHLMHTSNTISYALKLQKAFSVIINECSEFGSPSRLMYMLYPYTKEGSVYQMITPYDDDVIKLHEKIKNNTQLKEAKFLLDNLLANVHFNYEKLLVIDLCRLVVDENEISDNLLNRIKDQKLSSYRQISSSKQVIEKFLQEEMRTIFKQTHFSQWKKKHGKEFLKEKRIEERALKTYARPYLEYYDQKEKELFDAFWGIYEYPLMYTFLTGKTMLKEDENKIFLVYIQELKKWSEELSQGAHNSVYWKLSYDRLKKTIQDWSSDDALEYLKSLRGYRNLNKPLYGRYKNIASIDGIQLQKHLASGFYPTTGFGYNRSYSYRYAAPQGSIFKVITAYTGLLNEYNRCVENNKPFGDLNPFTITDVVKKDDKVKPPITIVGYNSEGVPIPQMYKGGRILKSLNRNIGKVDIVGALAYSSNSYFALLVGDYLKDPEQLNEAARSLGYGAKTGISLNGEYGGNLPKDIKSNRSGLYSYACGQHTLVVTPLQTAVAISAIVNGGKVFEPLLVKYMAGNEPIRGVDRLFRKSEFPYDKFLKLVNIDYPLFLEGEKRHQKQEIKEFSSKIKNEVFLPKEIKKQLLKGMRQSAIERRETTFHNYYDYPEYVKDYQKMKNSIVTKTSTAERLEFIDLDPIKGSQIYNGTWCAVISYPDSEQDLPIENRHPELVVVVYLRFGDYGKETPPLAVQVIKKWREIQSRQTKQKI